MPGELERAASDLMSALDSKDVDRIVESITDDAEGIDEISRRWRRGKDDTNAYLRELVSVVSNVHTELRDPNERIWGDTGVLTCWLDQDYTLEGKDQHVSAPTTIVFRREGGAWRATLFHSAPLPEEP